MAEKEKPRYIEESVPGMQITLAHIIRRPVDDLYEKLDMENTGQAIGLMVLTPTDAAIIAGDVAGKMANVNLVYVDRFGGALYFVGDTSSVEYSLMAVERQLKVILGVHLCPITSS
ncbi:MAG: BMC domain-containing protein [Lachnospiraceae bacterium]|nr:BMC domain-containing protein [Lachnospiraceae bacterium]